MLEALGHDAESLDRLGGQDRRVESFGDDVAAACEDGRPGMRAGVRQSHAHGATVVGIPFDMDQPPPLQALDEATGRRKRCADPVADLTDAGAGRVVPDDEERTPLEQAEVEPVRRLSECPRRHVDRGSRHELDRLDGLGRGVIVHRPDCTALVVR